MAQTVVPQVPLWAYEAWVARGVDWLAMTEDLPTVENKVTIESNGQIRLHYKPNNLVAHQELVDETKRILRKLGFWIVMTHSHKAKNTTHQCGTLVFGTNPAESVLDTYCRTHDIDNLFVVDASFFPSSAAVNPGLTIVAQAIRAADHIKGTRMSIGPGDRSARWRVHARADQHSTPISLHTPVNSRVRAQLRCGFTANCRPQTAGSRLAVDSSRFRTFSWRVAYLRRDSGYDLRRTP